MSYDIFANPGFALILGLNSLSILTCLINNFESIGGISFSVGILSKKILLFSWTAFSSHYLYFISYIFSWSFIEESNCFSKFFLNYSNLK